MNWLLPIALVLLAGIVFAAGHFVFVRWMARMTEPARAKDGADGSRGGGRRD